MRWLRMASWMAVLGAGLSSGVGAGQISAGETQRTRPGGDAGNPSVDASPNDPGRARMQEQQAKSRNDERQKKLVSDTAKLYELAGQLKEQVAKSDKNTLSVDVVKKAEEIEKLARSVKEKMRG